MVYQPQLSGRQSGATLERVFLEQPVSGARQRSYSPSDFQAKDGAVRIPVHNAGSKLNTVKRGHPGLIMVRHIKGLTVHGGCFRQPPAINESRK
ncbi:MAG: hypothetical protein ACOC0R_04610 [Mariniphaga sp.]